MTAGFSLSPEQLERLFPFNFVVDRSLTITHVGRSLHKLCPAMEIGQPLDTHFRRVRPSGPLSVDLLCGPQKLHVLESLTTPVVIRGQMKFVESGERLVFLGSPWLTDPAMLQTLGLSLSDFAVHDPAIDLLQLVQLQSTALNDTRRLAAILTRQRENLKKANEQLITQTAEARKLAMIAARTDNAVVLTDSTGKIEWVNDGFVRLTGYTLAEVMGKSPESMLQGPKTDSATVEWMRAAIAKGEPFEVELFNYAKDGREYWIAIDAQPIRDDSGRITHFMAMERDITEERSSRLRNQRLNQLQEMTQRIVTSFDADESMSVSINAILEQIGKFLDVSRAYLFRYRQFRRRLSNTHEWCAPGVAPQAQMLKELPGEQFPWWTEQLSQGRAIVIRDVDSDAPFEVRDKLLRQDIRAVLCLPVTINSELQSFIGFDDIRRARTWRQEEVALLQTMVESLSRAIERRVAERERAATSQHLADALSRAESANQLKSTFLAHMSHELRTPMTAITGFAKLLLRSTGSSEERKQWAVAINRNADHLLSLVNELLDLSKIEAGQLSVVNEVCDPLAIITEVVEHLRPIAHERGLSIDFVSHAPHLTLTTDHLRLRQIVFNLVSNAIKYTDRGSVRVLATAEPPHHPRTLRIDVQDTGIGIAPEQFERVFEPFNAAHTDASRRGGGIGLGLNISRRLATLLSGTLTFVSTEGTGSTFTLTLPVRARSSPRVNPAPVMSSSLPKQLNALADLRGVRILVAEDSVDNQRLLTYLLREAGASVQVACDGQEAVMAFTSSPDPAPFDAVLMDMQMPVLDGYAAAALLRQSGISAPIIALTAFAMADDRARCLEAGCNDYLSKPIDEARLLEVLSNLTSQSHAAEQQAEPSQPVPDSSWREELRRDFLASLSPRLEELQACLERGDIATIATLAHKLRGTAGNFGLDDIAAAASRFEDAYRSDPNGSHQRLAMELAAALCRTLPHS